MKAERYGANMVQKYWENEKPETKQTERNLLKYYKEAGKLQIALLYPDKETNELKQGKTVTLDSEDLAINQTALDMLQAFIDDSREMISGA